MWTAEDAWLDVEAVSDDSPAAAAGFEAGDRITHIDGRAARGWVRREVTEALAGGPSTVTVRRGEETLLLSLAPRFPLGR
jgi:C-terminal processing protease CtpA/Prc